MLAELNHLETLGKGNKEFAATLAAAVAETAAKDFQSLLDLLRQFRSVSYEPDENAVPAEGELCILTLPHVSRESGSAADVLSVRGKSSSVVTVLSVSQTAANAQYTAALDAIGLTGDQNSTLQALLGENMAGLTPDAAGYPLTINDQLVGTFAASDTLEAVLAAINHSSAGVTVVYLDGTLTFTATATGADGKIAFGAGLTEKLFIGKNYQKNITGFLINSKKSLVMDQSSDGSLFRIWEDDNGKLYKYSTTGDLGDELTDQERAKYLSMALNGLSSGQNAIAKVSINSGTAETREYPANTAEVEGFIVTFKAPFSQGAVTVQGGSLSAKVGDGVSRLADLPFLCAADPNAVPAARKVNGKALSADVTLAAADVGAVPTSRTVNGKTLSGNITLSAANVGAVPTTRKVNGKSLSTDVSLTAGDVGAVPVARKVNNKALSSDILLSAADVGAVPTTRKVNGLPLSSDISLSSIHVGARTNRNLLDNWYFVNPTNQRGLTIYKNSGFIIDRWIGARGTFELTTSGLKSLKNEGEPSQVLYENIDYIFPLEIPIVLSALIDGTLFSLVRTQMDTLQWFEAGVGLRIETLPEGNPPVQCANIYTVDTNPHILTAAKLELGTQQTLAHQDAAGNWVLNDPPPNKALELAKCQRYFQRLDIRRPASYDGSKYFSVIDLKTTMRVNPTISNISTYPEERSPKIVSYANIDIARFESTDNLTFEIMGFDVSADL